MPSSATTRNRFEKQGTGENTNTWGAKLNSTGLDLIDEALDGYESIALTGNLTLTSTNFASDQARKRFLKFTGSVPATITIPAVSKLYLIWNATSETLTITMGGSDTAVLPAGARQLVACTGSGVYSETAAPVATAAAAAAATSATNAATSASSASTAATAASASASSASTSATNAASSASAAAASAASLNASNLVDRTTAQTIAGLKTFSDGVRINGQTLDGLTAFGLSLAEAADANAAKALIGGASWTLVSDTGAITLVSSVDQTGLAGYSEAVVVWNTISHNDGSSRALTIQTSENNGSSYSASTTSQVSPPSAAAAALIGAVHLIFTAKATLMLPVDAGVLAGAKAPMIAQTAKANAIRLAWEAGLIDNGTVTIYAR